jgi:hypothetical protein
MPVSAKRGAVRVALLAGALVGATVATTPAPVAAGVTGFSLTAQKPGGTGLTAFGKYRSDR